MAGWKREKNAAGLRGKRLLKLPSRYFAFTYKFGHNSFKNLSVTFSFFLFHQRLNSQENKDRIMPEIFMYLSKNLDNKYCESEIP